MSVNIHKAYIFLLSAFSLLMASLSVGQEQVLDHSGHGCVKGGDIVEITLAPKSDQAEPIKFKIPKAYLTDPENRKGGNQTFISIDSMLDDLSPLCARPLNEKEINQGQETPNSQGTDETLDLKLTASIPQGVENIFEGNKETYPIFIRKDSRDFKIYRKDLSQESMSKYGYVEFIIPPEVLSLHTKFVLCHITPRSFGGERSFCDGYLMHKNKIVIQYSFHFSHLENLKALEEKVINLTNRLMSN